MATRDGRWRVEIVRRASGQFYRLVHRDNAVDDLVIASLERLLAEAGVDMAQLEDAPIALGARPARGVDWRRSYALLGSHAEEERRCLTSDAGYR